jgi:hypothetical protein
MKKLIATAAFLMFGTLFVSAQTTPKKENTRTKAEKSMKKSSTKTDTSGQNGMNGTTDTAKINNGQMNQDNNRMQQNQTLPNNGTNNGMMQNNGTMQNPNTTMPNNSTANPQVQPVSPVSPNGQPVR